MSKSRFFYLDVMRIVACLSVAFQHALLPWFESYGEVFTKCGVFMFESGSELFCMISGACLLGCVTDTKAFLKKRFIRIVPIVVIWTVIHLLWNMYLSGNELPYTWRYYCVSMLFSPQEGVLWFVYCISGLYLLTPVLNKWLVAATRREVEFYLLIWVVTSLIPIIGKYYNVISIEQTWYYCFSGYIGYYLLGYYLNKYRGGVNKILFAVAAIILSVAFLILNIVKEYGSSGMENAEIGCVLLTFGIFVLIRNGADKYNECIGGKYRDNVEKIAKLTFGVYLVHVVFDKWLYQNFPYGSMEAWERVLIDFGITVVASFLVVWLLSYLPFSRFIVGNHISLKKNK